MIFNSELAEKIFSSKYYVNGDKSPTDSIQRVLSVIGRYYPEIVNEAKHYIENKDIGLAGGLWRAAENKNKNVSVINCTTLGYVDDTLEDISDGWYKWAKYAAYGQGEGADFSRLRPSGSIVHNSSKYSTGSVSFMSTFDSILSIIAQQGRRGASLISLHITHPDIPEFINVKDKKVKLVDNSGQTIEERDYLDTANISIQMNNAFMKALEKEAEWTFTYKNEYETIKSETVPTQEIWRKIADQAWKTGDPGLQFIDTVKKYSNSDYLSDEIKIESTNACFSGDTKIAVADGRNAVTIEELAEEGLDIPVYSIDNDGNVEIQYGRNPRLTRKNAQLIEITLDDDTTIKVTPDHQFRLTNGNDYEAQYLQEGMSLARFRKQKNKISPETGYYYSIGGNINNLYKTRQFEHRMIAYFHDKETWNEIYDETKSNGFIKGNLVVHHKDENTLNNDPSNLTIMTFEEHNDYHNKQKDYAGENNPMYNKHHTKETKNVISEKVKNRFMDDEYRRNFSESVKKGITEKTREAARKSAKQFHYDFYKKFEAETDLETFWEDDRLYVVKYCEHCGHAFVKPVSEREVSYCSRECAGKDKKAKDKRRIGSKKYYQGRQKDILHQQVMMYKNLYEDLGREPYRKEWESTCRENNIPFRFNKSSSNPYVLSSYEELKTTANDYNHKIKSIRYLNEKEDVYNITVDNNHTVGVVTKEDEGFDGIFTLQCGEVPSDKQNVCLLSSYNLSKLYKHDEQYFRRGIQILTYILDAFRRYEIDEHRSPIKAQRQKLIDAPRIGIGVTGLGDHFIRNEITYGSDDSIEEAKRLFRIIASESYKTSYEIARRDGESFKYYDKEKYKKSPFVKRLLKENLIEDYHLDYQAHVTKLSIAPTGSLTEVVEAGAGGIEPLFSKYFVRRERATTGDWKEWFTYNNLVREYLKEQGQELTKENADSLPEHWVTAHEVDNFNKIQLIGEIQKYVDGAISVTYNLNADATPEDIEDIYYQAWKHELKGVTVYREGSKAGVLITDANYEETRKEPIPDTYDEHRPNTIPRVEAPKRPEELQCDIHQISVNKEKHIVLVGKLEDGSIYELFVTPNTEGKIDIGKHKQGIIKKVKKGHYQLIIMNGEEKCVVDNIGKEFDETYASLSRFISMGLRHGVDLQFVVTQLQKDTSFVSFEKAVARVLKKYIQEGEKLKVSETCPMCGSELVFIEGCRTCQNPECNWSACD